MEGPRVKNATKKKEMPFSGNTKSDTSQHQSTNQGHNKHSTLAFEQYNIMSQSLLDMHLRSAIATHKNIVSTSEGKKGKSGVQPTKKNKEKNFLDEARKQIQGKKQRVNTILKTLGEEGNTKKFSKRRLKSIIKVHRSNK